jgi:hypothetical protein
MVYCDRDTVINGLGTWRKHDGCRIECHGIRFFFNTGVDGFTFRGANFNWVGGKLAMGEDRMSFQKVRRKPKLICEQ